MWSDGINSFDGQGGEILSQCISIPNHYQVYFKYLNFVNYTSTKLNFFKSYFGLWLQSNIICQNTLSWTLTFAFY